MNKLDYMSEDFSMALLNTAHCPVVPQEGGYRALYRGLSPSLIGMVPYGGIFFFSFEYIKLLFMKHLPDLTCNKCQENTGW